MSHLICDLHFLYKNIVFFKLGLGIFYSMVLNKRHIVYLLRFKPDILIKQKNVL